MDRRAAIKILILLAFTLSIIGSVADDKLVKANPIAIPSLWIANPYPNGVTFTENSVPLIVELNVANWSSNLQSTQIYYSLDSDGIIFFSELSKSSVYMHPSGSSWIINANTTLTNLPNGNHNVTIYAKTSANDNLTKTIHFTITMTTQGSITTSVAPTLASAASLSTSQNISITPRLSVPEVLMWIIQSVAIAVSIFVVVFWRRIRNQ